MKSLTGKFKFLRIEDSWNVELMQLLIDIIDAHLLEIILCETFETENIKQTNSFSHLLEGICSFILR